jgi:hypothetical protein
LDHTEQVTNQRERDIDGITLNEQKLFKKVFSIRLIEFVAQVAFNPNSGAPENN